MTEQINSAETITYTEVKKLYPIIKWLHYKIEEAEGTRNSAPMDLVCAHSDFQDLIADQEFVDGKPLELTGYLVSYIRFIRNLAQQEEINAD